MGFAAGVVGIGTTLLSASFFAVEIGAFTSDTTAGAGSATMTGLASTGTGFADADATATTGTFDAGTDAGAIFCAEGALSPLAAVALSRTRSVRLTTSRLALGCPAMRLSHSSHALLSAMRYA